MALAGLAWLTRNPDSKIVEKAQDWPVVGPLASRFRQAYLPPPAPPPAERSGLEEAAAEVVAIELDPEDVEALPFVWVRAETELYEGPDKQSPVLWRESSIRNLSVLEQRGDWYRVRVPRPGDRTLQAWVILENYQEPTLEALRQPDPVLPLPSTPPHAERISAARQLMENRGRRADCGLYPLFAEVLDEAFAELCPRVTRSLEEAYRQRYGVEPVSPPAEVIFLFRHASVYKVFRDQEQVPFESNLAHASPAAGYVALYQGDRSTGEILGTLVHELTHLLNRRALGPALPAWLSEGIADDLADSRMSENGSLQPGRLGGESRIEGLRVTRKGAVAAAIDLQEALRADDLPPLETLVEMDRQQFHDPERVQLHYALSSFWVRYLLSGFDPELKMGFQSFLRDIGSGEPLTGELLLENLGSDWQGLESGFRTWMHLQFLTPPNEIPAASP